MNRKFFSILSVVAVAFALVFGLGTLDTAKAVPGMNGDGYTAPEGTSNLFGIDGADITAGAGTIDRDRGNDMDRDKAVSDYSYGLWGKSQL